MRRTTPRAGKDDWHPKRDDSRKCSVQESDHAPASNVLLKVIAPVAKIPLDLASAKLRMIHAWSQQSSTTMAEHTSQRKDVTVGPNGSMGTRSRRPNEMGGPSTQQLLRPKKAMTKDVWWGQW